VDISTQTNSIFVESSIETTYCYFLRRITRRFVVERLSQMNFLVVSRKHQWMIELSNTAVQFDNNPRKDRLWSFEGIFTYLFIMALLWSTWTEWKRAIIMVMGWKLERMFSKEWCRVLCESVCVIETGDDELSCSNRNCWTDFSLGNGIITRKNLGSLTFGLPFEGFDVWRWYIQLASMEADYQFALQWLLEVWSLT
jgi:hypothetical protein